MEHPGLNPFVFAKNGPFSAGADGNELQAFTGAQNKCRRGQYTRHGAMRGYDGNRPASIIHGRSVPGVNDVTIASSINYIFAKIIPGSGHSLVVNRHARPATAGRNGVFQANMPETAFRRLALRATVRWWIGTQLPPAAGANPNRTLSTPGSMSRFFV